jgi:hypothetical protein
VGLRMGQRTRGNRCWGLMNGGMNLDKKAAENTHV